MQRQNLLNRTSPVRGHEQHTEEQLAEISSWQFVKTTVM